MKSHWAEVHEEADDILLNLRSLEQRLSGIVIDASSEIELIKERHQAKISEIEKDIKTREKELKRLAGSRRAELFGKRDRIDLENGALMFAITRRVKKAKGMLERLKEYGYGAPAVKVAESVNWDELEKWPDDQLKQVGTERIVKEEFNYELF